MIIVLLLLFITFPAIAIQVGDCYIYPYPDPASQWTIVCYPNPELSDTPILNKEACENLKDSLMGIITNVKLKIDDVVSEQETVYATILNVGKQIGDLTSSVELYWENDDISSNVYHDVSGQLGQIKMNVDEARDTALSAKLKGEQASDQLNDAIRSVASYACPENQDCSGGGEGGTMKCPCQDVLGNILDGVYQIHGEMGSIITNTAALKEVATDILSNFISISNNLELIANRLNAPDDRIWGELIDLYAQFATNVQEWATMSMNYSDLFYRIRELIRGDGSDNETMKLTTEGALILHGLASQWASLSLQQYQTAQNERILLGFTNSVERLYHLFKDISLPTSASHLMFKYSQLYNVMTNTSLSPYSRYLQFVSKNGASVTNWFQRMELYQQALLGWFDPVLETAGLVEEQDELDDTRIEHSFEYTTNKLGKVSESFESTTNSLGQYNKILSDAFKNVQLEPRLPAYVEIFPETEITDGITFPRIVFETGDISTYLNIFRDVTRLIWQVLIWIFYGVLIYGLVRLFTLGVLWIIKFLSKV